MLDRSNAPEVIKEFLIFHETIKGHSKKTVDEYYLDLRTFFRFLKIHKGVVPQDTPFDEISIDDIDINFVGSVTLADIYAFLNFLSRDREKHYNSRSKEYGLNANSRARKISTIRSYYKYLTLKTHQLDKNPVQDLDSPKIMKSLPRYLSLDESKQLLSSVSGKNKERDYCILMIFLSCGLRISELINLKISDVRPDHLRVLGKGNKERVVYLNDACIEALNNYLEVRKTMCSDNIKYLFISNQRQQISRSTVHYLIKKHLAESGLDSSKYSAHKLRHTAATLMLHNGVDVRTLQELLGHEHLNTTEIYTHVENEGLRQAAALSPFSGFSPSNKTDGNTEDGNDMEDEDNKEDESCTEDEKISGDTN